jgi:hypothetical protein
MHFAHQTFGTTEFIVIKYNKDPKWPLLPHLPFPGTSSPNCLELVLRLTCGVDPQLPSALGKIWRKQITQEIIMFIHRLIDFDLFLHVT